MPTRATLIRAGTGILQQAGISDAGREARLLMRWACDLSGAGLAARLEEDAEPEQETRFAIGLERRAGREPLSHITGRRQFWDRDFRVTLDVLDPRPETEVLVAEALNRGPFGRILDLGTGTGCILVTLLSLWPDAKGTGTDISRAALAVARGNAEEAGVLDRIDLVEADWLDGLSGTYDLIVSNPPYLAEGEIPGLEPEVRNHEPQQALTPGGDGLDAYRQIATGIAGLMTPGGYLMLEIGPTQSVEVSAILAAGGLNVNSVLPDLDQRPRVITARL